jgi:hypothetical protein
VSTLTAEHSALVVVGWREWVHLPALGLGPIEAKLDTGARTSALHVDELEALPGHQVRFWFAHPGAPHHTGQRVTAPVVDQREIRSSNGQTQLRHVIRTTLELGPHAWEAEFTLTCRRNMRYPMLMGRLALEGKFLVHSGLIHVFGNLMPSV